MARDWHREHLDHRTFGQRLADTVAKGVGSWGFIIAQSVLVVVWVSLNVFGWIHHWDPFPFILLNLLFSVQAAYTAPVIMMSQNRAADRDRLESQADYETNIQAEAEIEMIQIALARIEEEHLKRIIRLLENGATSDTCLRTPPPTGCWTS